MKDSLNSLLKDLSEVYKLSDINQECIKNRHKWYYSLINTTMKQGGPLILGFNWGASVANGKKYEYEPQSSIKEIDFKKEDVGSLSRIFPYCEQYFGNDFLSRTSQSNYCFFRSKTEKQISSKDMGLCEPIFEELVKVVKPTSIICLSSKLRDYLIRNEKISSKEVKQIVFTRGSSNITYEAIKATLTSGIEISFLPHPNYPMKGEARSAAWEFCCG